MNHILIYGAPGAGKTTVSDALHEETKIPITHGDFIREFPGTKSAWRKYGALTKEKAIIYYTLPNDSVILVV
jgi:adenylate kinase family enzyme